MNNRGISLVIASLLFIVIAVAAVLLVYSWITGYSSGLATQSYNEGSKIKLYVKIDGIQPLNRNDNGCIPVSSDCKPGKYYCYLVWVNNIGDQKVYIKDLYVIDPTKDTVIWYSIYTSGGIIDPKVNQYLWLSVPCEKVERGKKYFIKLTLRNGYEVYYSYVLRP